MTFGESIRSAWNFISGNGAHVTLELDTRAAYPGDELAVRVVIQSTGAELTSAGVMLDFQGEEEIDSAAFSALDLKDPSRTRPRDLLIGGDTTTVNAAFRLCDPFRLEAGKSTALRAKVRVPASARPTYKGVYAKHTCKVRARIDVTGTDPTSDWFEIKIGVRL